MNDFTKEMIDELANKLLIGLTEEENKMVLDEFQIIEKSINTINEIPNIKDVLPMSYCLDDQESTYRDDELSKCNDIDDLLKNCDQYYGREVEIPKVVGE